MINIFELRNKETISKEEIHLIVSNLLIQTIEDNEPHLWYKTEEPFINGYTGSISYDYSGEVKEMMCKDLINLKKQLGKREWSDFIYSSKMDELMSSIYINQWNPSYESNRGKNWVTYKDIVEDKFNQWKYSNFDLYTEEGEELNEDLDTDLDCILGDFFELVEYDLYYTKILKKLKSS